MDLNKLKELARKVEVSIDSLGYGEGNIDALADLIVQECARIANEVDDTMTNQGAASARAFKEYFGVQ